MKDYLTVEGQRNKAHAQLYTDIVQAALGKENAVLIGHHIVFEANGDLTTENEIPAADTLIFDHDIMRAVFGDRALPIMMKLASLPVGQRDDHLQALWDQRCSASVPPPLTFPCA